MPKSCKKRSIRNLGETAELPQFSAEIEEKDEQGIGRDGKNLLQDKGGKKSFQRVGAFSAKALIESLGKLVRNELAQVEVFIQKLKE